MTSSFVVASGLVGLLAVVGFYDAWCVFQGDQAGTVSAQISLWARRWPLLPFAAGVLADHLFGHFSQ